MRFSAGLGQQLGVLTGARWRMWVNSVRARPSIALVAGAGFVAFVVPMGLVVGLGTYRAYETLSSPSRDELMHLVLAGTFLLWVLFPLYSTTMQRTVDARPLRILPLSSARLALLVTVSAFGDATILGLLPSYFPIIAAYAGWRLAWCTVPVLGALTFCAVTLSCAVALALYRVGAGGRRLGWLLPLASAVPAAALYYWFARLTFVPGGQFVPGELLRLPWSQWLRWTPAGWAGESIRTALAGREALSLLYFLALLGGCGAALALHAWLVGLGTPQVSGKRAQEVRPAAGARPGPPRWLWGPVWTMAVREVRCLIRDVQVRTAMITTPLAVLPILVMARLMEGQDTRLYLAAFAVPLAAVVAGSVFFNTFGMEREGVAATFLQPTDRRLVLLGKNLGDALLSMFVVGPVLLLAALVGHSVKFAVGGLAGLTLATPPVLAVANYWAIEFPFRTPKRGENPFHAGFLAMWLIALVHMLGVSAGALLAAPVLLLVLVGFTWAPARFLLLLLPLAAAYAVLVYWTLLAGAARRLLESEPDIVEAVTARTRRWAR